MRHRESQERNRFLNHLHSAAYPSAVATDHTIAPVYEILVDGIKFAVVKGGSKLVKLPGAPCPAPLPTLWLRPLTHTGAGDANGPKATPKMATVGGVKFYRTKTGNMYRQAAVKAQRYVTLSAADHALTRPHHRRCGAVSKVNVPCTKFSTTGISISAVPMSFVPGLFPCVCPSDRGQPTD